MIGQLKLCKMRLPYRQRQLKSGLLHGAETPSSQCARQSQRCGNDPAAGGEESCNHTRAALLGRSLGQVREGRNLSEEISPLLADAMCSRIY